jgi:pyruvate/2-oxoacid:ferredoxin oxidoreductase alpha subunit
LRLRMVRPFPGGQICEALRGARKVAVIDRDFSPGCGGILAQEIKSALQGNHSDLPVYEFIAGLGGKDVTDRDIEGITEQTHHTPKPGESTWIGLLK